MSNAENIWKATLGNIQLEISKSVFTTWFENTKGLSVTDNEFVVGVPNDITATTLKERYLSNITRCLFKHLNREVTITFTVDWDATKKSNYETPEYALFNIDPNLSFENFVVGPSNQLAHAAAMNAASGNANDLYNPLFICASPGLGKTHLLQAIGQRSLENNLKPYYTSCSSLISECMASFKNGSTEELKTKYASYDVLMIDDIHDLAGKESTQSVFFNIFNTARAAGHQIVVTSDRTPEDMDKIADRLKSRFQWGLITDIQKPDFAMRLAILKTRAANRQFEISDELLAIIAEDECENVRELEGRLNRVEAYARLLNEPVTQELIQKALQRFVKSNSTAGSKVNEAKRVIDEVASTFGVTPESLLSSSRDQKTALARQVAMFILKQYGYSLLATGKIFGNRTPSTVSHAIEKVGNILINDAELQSAIDTILKKLSK